MYHQIFLEDLLDLVNIHHAYGRSLPSGIEEKIGRMFGWLSTMCHPDGEISFFNDAALGVTPSVAEIRAYGERLGFYPNDDGTYIQVRNKSGKNNFYLKPFKSISSVEWTSYKIGIYVSENNRNGWVKFYRNGNLLFKFQGDTYSHDGGRYKHSNVRIGVYRTSGIKGIDEIEADSDTLHFDDFIVASAEEMIDSIHSKFYKIDKSIKTQITYDKFGAEILGKQHNKVFKFFVRVLPV